MYRYKGSVAVRIYVWRYMSIADKLMTRRRHHTTPGKCWISTKLFLIVYSYSTD